jgi:hypothetical protein
MVLWAEVIWRSMGTSGRLFCPRKLIFDRHKFAELLDCVGDCTLVVSSRTEHSGFKWKAYLIILQFSTLTKPTTPRVFSPSQLFSVLTQILKPLVATNYTASSGSNN